MLHPFCAWLLIESNFEGKLQQNAFQTSRLPLQGNHRVALVDYLTESLTLVSLVVERRSEFWEIVLLSSQACHHLSWQDPRTTCSHQVYT